jgi:hypothetical protein
MYVNVSRARPVRRRTPIEHIVNIRRRLEPAIFDVGERKASRVEVITF